MEFAAIVYKPNRNSGEVEALVVALKMVLSLTLKVGYYSKS